MTDTCKNITLAKTSFRPVKIYVLVNKTVADPTRKRQGPGPGQRWRGEECVTWKLPKPFISAYLFNILEQSIETFLGSLDMLTDSKNGRYTITH